ncbi:tRNA uridine-5-carboxymethylaminomethyl(34) synthesis GTPase MnmE [bacterium]|nr:tRNA uridine-5-carboxymethylaminomethyl(34) synthesis GTPase MnmE [bacterium]
MDFDFDTITAPATALGTSGVAVIRISGAKTFEIVNKIFKGKIEIGKICYGKIVDNFNNNQTLDEVILLPFKTPHSFTGEDVIEIQCHGGLKVIDGILNLILKNGARIAQRGEFTKRAFLNKKMDLSQAEAVLDIIHSKTSVFAQKNADNLSGALSKHISEIRKDLLDLMSKIVAGIDFPEDVKEPKYEELEEVVKISLEKIDEILKSAKSSNLMRQGLKVAIAGKPNVGKSSLFNRLLSQNRAIVTEIAGTTRDIIQESLDMDGIPVTLIDTAGIREDEDIDKVEKIGIDYSKKAVENAELILFMYDSSTPWDETDSVIYDMVKCKPFLKIANKSDIGTYFDSDSIKISTKTGENIAELRALISKKVIGENEIENIDYVTNKRQQECLLLAKKHLETALDAIMINELQDLISIDIKSALLALDEISGEVITDEILNNIFENFCIGK